MGNVGAFKLINQHYDGPLPALFLGPQYKAVYEHWNMSTSQIDNSCQIKSGTIVVIENIAFSQELKQTVIIGRKCLHKYNLYSDPSCESSHLEIHKVSKL